MTHEKNPEKEESQKYLPDLEELARELVKAESIDDFYGKDGIFAWMFLKTIEQMLEAEPNWVENKIYLRMISLCG